MLRLGYPPRDPDRWCGDEDGACGECCEYFKIEEVGSEAGEQCGHFGCGGCSIHKDPSKPKICEEMLCGYLLGWGELPRNSGVMAELMPQYPDHVIVSELWDGASEEEAGIGSIKDIAEKSGFRVSVVKYNNLENV